MPIKLLCTLSEYLYDTPISVLAKCHVAAKCLATPHRPGSHKKDVPNQNAWSYVLKLLLKQFFTSLLERKFFYLTEAMLSQPYKMPKEGLQQGKSQWWKAKYTLVLYYTFLRGTGPDWWWGAIVPQPTTNPQCQLCPAVRRYLTRSKESGEASVYRQEQHFCGFLKARALQSTEF